MYSIQPKPLLKDCYQQGRFKTFILLISPSPLSQALKYPKCGFSGHNVVVHSIMILTVPFINA